MTAIRQVKLSLLKTRLNEEIYQLFVFVCLFVCVLFDQSASLLEVRRGRRLISVMPKHQRYIAAKF